MNYCSQFVLFAYVSIRLTCIASIGIGLKLRVPDIRITWKLVEITVAIIVKCAKPTDVIGTTSKILINVEIAINESKASKKRYQQSALYNSISRFLISGPRTAKCVTLWSYFFSFKLFVFFGKALTLIYFMA